ncbi:MAG: hypothetical protein VW619_05735, partial [Rhodobiaceae bacterium]
MAWMLLIKGMSAVTPPRSISFISAFVCCVMAVLFVAPSALAQTGLSTVRLTDQQDGFAGDGFA